jgi:hypothetical protein
MNETELKEKILQKIEGMEQDTLLFIDRFLDSFNAYRADQRSLPVILPFINGEPSSNGDERKAIVSRLRGMAAQSTLSSEQFALSKQAEIDWEDRNL